MKPYLTLAAAAALLIAAGYATASSDSASTSDSAAVLGVHHHTLKEVVSPEEYELFVADKLTPLLNERIPFTR
jgi:ABC-type glycerol-3-phosphate transport system substrate-binding protein